MKHRFGCLVLLALAALAVSCNEKGTVTVHSLAFKGIAHIDESTLRSGLATHANSKLPWGKKAYFDRARFDADLKRIQTFYVDRGYADARVTGFDVNLNQAQDAVDITVTVSEGAPVMLEALNLAGFDVLPTANVGRLKKQIPLKVGQPRDRQLVLSTHELSLNALRDAGYPYATVSISEDDGQNGKSATLTFTAVPGQLAHFGPVAITGNTHVSDAVIRRGLSYKEGDLYRRSRLQETQHGLYSTALFDFVNVQPVAPGTKSTQTPAEDVRLLNDVTPAIPSVAPPAADQVADVPTGITVAEAKPQRINFGAGYGTEEKARVDAEYHRLNFLGGGRTAGAHVRWSSLDRGARLDFNQPYLFLPQVSLGGLAQQWSTYTPAYHSVVSGGKAILTYRMSERTHWAVSITSERDTSSISSNVLTNLALRNNLIALGLDPTTGQQSGTLNAIGLDFQQSTADSVLNADHGHQLTVHVEQAGKILPGTFRYWSSSADGRQYLPLGHHVVWANRIQVGTIVPPDNASDVPFGKRFFLGGATSIRGWGIYEVGPLAGGLPVGGDSMAAFTSEMRAPLRGNLGGVAFLDGGNVWADSFGMNVHDLRYAIGTGLRYQTRIGPIRFDVGYQLNPEPGLLVNGSPQSRRWRVHFSVGQAF